MKLKSLSVKLLLTLFIAAGLINCSVQAPVTYMPSLKNSLQAFNVGKTAFDVMISDQNGSSVSGLTVEADPQMDMGGGMMHSTPVESVTDNGDGSYTVIAYFLMDSSGGTWTLHFHVNGQHLAEHIPINVGGNMMMDKGTLKGVTSASVPDQDYYIPMTGSAASNRPYFIFKSAFDTVANTVDLYLATRDNDMYHPAVFSGQTLTNGSGNAWTAGTVVLSVCTNWSGSACAAWTDLADQGNGHYTGTVPASFFLTDTDTSMMAAGNQFAVHLQVANSTQTTYNNNWKTSNGSLSTANPGTGDGAAGTAPADGNEFVHINQ